MIFQNKIFILKKKSGGGQCSNLKKYIDGGVDNKKGLRFFNDRG